MVIVAQDEEDRALEIALGQGHDPQTQDLYLVVLVPVDTGRVLSEQY